MAELSEQRQARGRLSQQRSSWTPLGAPTPSRHHPTAPLHGQLRQTVLEVLRHDHASGTYIIASGFGPQADWFRNIQKTPRVLVASGGRRWEATAEPLSVPATGAELRDYARRHPRALRALSQLMIGERMTGSPESCQRLAERIPLVALRPRQPAYTDSDQKVCRGFFLEGLRPSKPPRFAHHSSGIRITATSVRIRTALDSPLPHRYPS